MPRPRVPGAARSPRESVLVQCRNRALRESPEGGTTCTVRGPVLRTDLFATKEDIKSWTQRTQWPHPVASRCSPSSRAHHQVRMVACWPARPHRSLQPQPTTSDYPIAHCTVPPEAKASVRPVSDSACSSHTSPRLRRCVGARVIGRRYLVCRGARAHQRGRSMHDRYARGFKNTHTHARRRVTRGCRADVRILPVHVQGRLSTVPLV